MEPNLFDYQVPHIENIVKGFEIEKLCIDQSPPGSGKTETSVRVAKMMGMKAFVIAGKNILMHWIQTLNKYNMNYDVVNYECLKKGFIYEALDGKTHSFKPVKFSGIIPPNTLVIFDEIHVCKNVTENKKMLDRLIKQNVPILGLSATLKDKKEYLPEHLSFRMEVVYPFTNTIEYTLPVEKARQPTFDLTSARKLEIKKVPLYLEYFNKRKYDDVIIFANYNETLGILAKKLARFNPVIVNGGQDSITNNISIMNFQTNGGLLLINSLSGGQSINLQDLNGNKPRFVIANLMWSGTLFRQMLDRSYRINSKSNTHQIILVTDDPLDKYMYWVLHKKMSFMRGVPISD